MTGEERSNGGSERHPKVHGRAEPSWDCEDPRLVDPPQSTEVWDVVIELSLPCLGEQQESTNARSGGPNLAGRESCGGDGPRRYSTVTATKDERPVSSSSGKPRCTGSHRSNFCTSTVSRCAVDKVTSSWRISPPQGLSSIQALDFFRCRRSGRGVQNLMRKTQRWADGSSVSDVLAKLEELWGPTARLLAGTLQKKKTQVERLDAERRMGPWGKVLLAGGVRFPPVETATLRAVLGAAPEVRCARRREACLWKARLQGCPTLGPKRRRTGSRSRDREEGLS